MAAIDDGMAGESFLRIIRLQEGRLIYLECLSYSDLIFLLTLQPCGFRV